MSLCNFITIYIYTNIYIILIYILAECIFLYIFYIDLCGMYMFISIIGSWRNILSIYIGFGHSVNDEYELRVQICKDSGKVSMQTPGPQRGILKVVQDCFLADLSQQTSCF